MPQDNEFKILVKGENESLKQKNQKTMEEKIGAFGDIVEKIMQIIFKIPDLVDNKLQDINNKFRNLENQMIAINRDVSSLKSNAAGDLPISSQSRTLEKLKEQFKEFKKVKKCPNCSDVITNYNIKICEKCGSELIKEKKKNFKYFMSNIIEDKQLIIKRQQAYIMKLEEKLRFKNLRKDEDDYRVTRRGNWGYGRKLKGYEDGRWDGILY